MTCPLRPGPVRWPWLPFPQGQAQAERLRVTSLQVSGRRAEQRCSCPKLAAPEGTWGYSTGGQVPRGRTSPSRERSGPNGRWGSPGRRDPRSAVLVRGLACPAGSLQVGEPGTRWACGSWVVCDAPGEGVAPHQFPCAQESTIE